MCDAKCGKSACAAAPGVVVVGGGGGGSASTSTEAAYRGCCHDECLGGCDGPDAGDCHVCRNFIDNENHCRPTCMPGIYTVRAPNLT